MTHDPTSAREARFTRLYEQHHETVRRYVWRRDPDLTDDVAAETFLVAWRRLDEVPADAAPWLIGVARNVRRNARRSVRRQEAVSSRLADAVPPLAGAGAAREPAALRAARSGRHRPRPLVVLAVGAAVVVGAGAAWASGTLSPVALFRSNPQGEGTSPGDLWHQRVVPASVRRAAVVHIPHVGGVQLWYARSRSHGWCAALRLPGGDWLGTDRSRFDAGGTVPGCYPTRAQINSQGAVYVLNGFDDNEDIVDPHTGGGAVWRIEFGRVTIPGAVRVADVVSGRSAPIARGGAFALALPFPNATDTRMRLVAYDAAGKVVGHA